MCPSGPADGITDELFQALVPLLRSGGGVGVITNGTPLWLQDSAWSRALRGFLEESFGQQMTDTCGTDEASQQRYCDSLIGVGFAVREGSIEYNEDLDLEHLVGGLFSAFSVDKLPARTSDRTSPTRSAVRCDPMCDLPNTSACECCSVGSDSLGSVRIRSSAMTDKVEYAVRKPATTHPRLLLALAGLHVPV